MEVSSQLYAAPLSVEPGFSAALATGLALGHGGAVIILLLLPMPGWLKWLGVVLIVCALTLDLVSHVLRRGPWAVRAVTWWGDGDWPLVDAAGEVHDCELLLPAYAHPWLTVLRFKVHGRRRTRVLVLASDAGATESGRRLRARLRSMSGAAGAAAP